MDSAKEFLPYLELATAVVSGTLAVVLASSARRLAGRGWLIASVTIALAGSPVDRLLSLVGSHAEEPQQVYQWFEVLHLLWAFEAGCFGMFLFALWSSSRMRLEMRSLLFSFSGRIPRSAFWILACILFQVGTVVGWAPFTTQAEGTVRGVIWAVYAAWMAVGLWISLAVYAKRWHDCGKSGWMSLIQLLPGIGLFWLFGYCGFVRGSSGPNQYGEDPFSPSPASVPPPPTPTARVRGRSFAICAKAMVAILVAVLAICGVIAALATPKLLKAAQTRKQERTMADMRVIAVACEAYAVDNNGYPDASSIEELAKFVEPLYIKTLPRLDAWRNGFSYRALSQDSQRGPQEYVVVSPGRNGVLDERDLTGYSQGETRSFSDDIVFSNSSFVQVPEAAAR